MRLFTDLLKLFTYKDSIRHEFFIPEVNNSECIDQNNNEEKKDSTDKTKKEIKQPIPVQEWRSEELSSKDQETISGNFNKNIDYFKKIFNSPNNKDIVIRQFILSNRVNGFIVYLDGMVDRTTINSFILRPLLKTEIPNISLEEDSLFDFILKRVIETNQITIISNQSDAVYGVLTGDTILCLDGFSKYIMSETKGFDKRGIEKPVIEAVVEGAQEAFTENLRSNVTLVRKIVKDSNLTTEFVKIGKRNNNLCAIMYINNLINPAIVEEIKSRIKSLETDFISGNGMLEQFIDDNPFALFPAILTTERPDRSASFLMEGRVVVISDGVPLAIVAPITLISFFHSSEDSALRWQYGTFLRIIRYFAFAVASLLPGFYIALTNFHREMIPTDLLLAIAKARETVPFPTIAEILFMEISFELIREAGIRIPGIVGNTLGIIGGLILGQAAVQANLVSPVLIIIIAITGLGNFAMPNFNLGFGARIIRFFFIILGYLAGFFGISLGIITTIIWIANTKSFGVGMLSPIGPKTKKGNDIFIRKPIWKQEARPDELNPLDRKRQPDISRKWTVNKE